MDQTALIEDIVATKNSLIILHQVFIVNQIVLQPFSPIFDSITELIDIFTHSSATQIETVLVSTRYTHVFEELRHTLNELSDAITTKNTSTIDSLNKRLSFCVQHLRTDSSYAANNEQTADDIFKKQLLQSHIDANARFLSERAESLEQLEEKSSTVDPFAQFRFARRKPPPKLSTAKPRLMISYNHESKPVCLDIYHCLTKDGYNVWIDLERMHGSILVAMAKGIDDSDIILYCVTEKYSQSTNCQKEAEYAFIQQKIMIPLILQAKYKPTGWLGLLLGASLYIDFTKNDFTQNYEKLKREIEANAMHITSNQNEVAKLTLDSNTNDKEQSEQTAANPPLQSTKTNSVATRKQSRSCVLF